MNATDWLSQHAGDVPPALAARLRLMLADERDPALTAADEFTNAGARALQHVLEAEPMTRAHALDVLAADALVTYAFEAAAEDPSRLAQHADAAMNTIATLAEGGR